MMAITKSPDTLRRLVWWFAATALLMSAACSSVGPNPTAPADLQISNGTTLVLALVVNGTTVRSVAPGAVEKIAPSELPPQPWYVEARSPSGRLLTSMTVRAGDVSRTSLPNGGTQYKGDAARIDLSCGRLDIWAGPPLLGPPPGPGSPGDCAP